MPSVCATEPEPDQVGRKARRVWRRCMGQALTTTMRQPPDNTPSARRVVLPSGKAIEVAFFPHEPQRAPSPSEHGLHVCGACDSRLVHPVAWEEAGALHWEVFLQCPNCGSVATGVFDQETVERFDDELERGTQALVRDLKRLMHANMEDEVERFVAALHAGHIEPGDF